MAYEALIAKATGVSDPIALANIEAEMMRAMPGHMLTTNAFNKLARVSALNVATQGAAAIADYAASLCRLPR